MCGVAACSSPVWSIPVLDSLHRRGPDAFGHADVCGVRLYHTRLAILDLEARSNQPMRRGQWTISYNGELWNHDILRRVLRNHGRDFTTEGDTEVVAWALDTWDVHAFKQFEGMFALVAVADDGRVVMARDRYGEMPLHVSLDALFDRIYHFACASDLRTLRLLSCHDADLLAPGTALILYPDTSGGYTMSRYDWGPTRIPDEFVVDRKFAGEQLRWTLGEAVRDRRISDVPVCTLVSGGVDSTVIALELAKHVPNLVAYTARMDERSADLKAARASCSELGIELVEVDVPVPTEEDLRGVVRTIEMPFKAQVEIGWACSVLARRIRDDGFKVVFSGEGSDELWGSYGFSYHALKHVWAGQSNDPDGDFARYRRELFLDQHRKNFPRCNKIFMGQGIECRLPFLHSTVVDLALGMGVRAVVDRRPDGRPSRPKAILYDAYSDVLPAAVMDRTKVAFQDGLGLKRAIADTIANPKLLYRQEASKL